MKPRSVLYIVIGVLLLVLVIKNWSVISPSTQLDLIFVDMKAPLGVLILLISGAILAIDFVIYSLNRLTWASERRELAAQIEQQRLRADQAEESRIQTLRDSLEKEMTAIQSKLDQLLRRSV